MNFKRLERLEKRILEPERGENVYFDPADFSENEQAVIINCLDEHGQLKNLDCVPLELLKKILRLSEETRKKPARGLKRTI